MFTGIVEAVGKIIVMEIQNGDARVRVATGSLDMSNVLLGDSIAVNGVCLTAIEHGPSGFTADVSGETLACTTLGNLRAGDRVNLEKALTPSARLGGHIVSGHVDGVGEVLERQHEARSVRFRIHAPAVLARYIAAKGSVCVDGVSLTVNTINGAVFEFNAVPHSLQATTLDDYRSGRKVNLEVDLIARYLERLLLGERAVDKDTTLNRAFLAEHGILKK